ncbi:MAG: T9SS type A sorting domain-containing protein [Bacteroidota bacterium]
MKRFVIFTISIILAAGLFGQNNVTPQTLTTLSTTVNESSGLVNIDNAIWTHNDSGGLPCLYQIDSANGSILRTVNIMNASNVDWEDLAFDSTYVYIGDFGNNSGSRTDLKVYRILRSALATSNTVQAETINFSYSDQTSWVPSPNATDFDCESFISYQGSLYLFSKDWVDHKTRMYQLISIPGTRVAQYQSTFDALGLITAAEMLPNNVLVLQAYTATINPYTWLFQQFTGTNFFAGTSTKLTWSGFIQTEGVCFADTNGVFVSSEKLGFPFNAPASLFYLDLSPFFITPPPNGIRQNPDHFKVFADPVNIYIKRDFQAMVPATIIIINSIGQTLKIINDFLGTELRIPITFGKGIYLVNIHTSKGVYTGKIMIP